MLQHLVSAFLQIFCLWHYK